MVICVLKSISTGEGELARSQLGIGVVRQWKADFPWSSRIENHNIPANVEFPEDDSLIVEHTGLLTGSSAISPSSST